jgi:hypothetical protein
LDGCIVGNAYRTGAEVSRVQATSSQKDFEQTAVKLSQGPLGIIALFIVLIHGFASLVLAFSQGLGEGNRTVLVWFLVLFPAFVFAVFAWLVGTRHQKLYPPTAFRNEDLFRDLAYGRASFDQQVSPAPAPEKIMATVGSLKRHATGNLYWLGHDLMWTADTLLRRGPIDQVLIGFDQAIHHLFHVGLSGTAIDVDLQALRTRVEAGLELTATDRDEVANRVGSIIDKIGAVLEAAQPDFETPPHWSRARATAS